MAEVVKGTRKDPTLSFQLANGMVVLDVVPEYLEDTESRGFATLLEWLNEYVTTVGLQASEPYAALEGEEALRTLPRPARVRIAAHAPMKIEFIDYDDDPPPFCKAEGVGSSLLPLLPD